MPFQSKHYLLTATSIIAPLCKSISYKVVPFRETPVSRQINRGENVWHSAAEPQPKTNTKTTTEDTKETRRKSVQLGTRKSSQHEKNFMDSSTEEDKSKTLYEWKTKDTKDKQRKSLRGNNIFMISNTAAPGCVFSARKRLFPQAVRPCHKSLKIHLGLYR